MAAAACAAQSLPACLLCLLRACLPPPALFARPRRAPCRHPLRLTLRSHLSPLHPHHPTPRPQPPWLVAPPAHAFSHRMHTAHAATSARRVLCRIAAAARDRRSFSAARSVALAQMCAHSIALRRADLFIVFAHSLRLRGAPHATAGGAVTAAMTGGLAKRGSCIRRCRPYRSLLRVEPLSALRHVPACRCQCRCVRQRLAPAARLCRCAAAPARHHK